MGFPGEWKRTAVTGMSGEELHAMLRDSGGFSVSSAGRSPHSGQMMARSGTERIHPGIASPERLESYLADHHQHLNRRGYYVGGWVETTPEGHKQTVLDVSQRFPAGHDEAVNLQGVIHDQRAYYDVGTGEAIPVNRDVLPMDYSGLDIKDVHYPARRAMSQVVGEIARRNQTTRHSVHTQNQLPGIDWSGY